MTTYAEIPCVYPVNRERSPIALLDLQDGDTVYPRDYPDVYLCDYSSRVSDVDDFGDSGLDGLNFKLSDCSTAWFECIEERGIVDPVCLTDGKLRNGHHRWATAYLLDLPLTITTNLSRSWNDEETCYYRGLFTTWNG